MDQFTSKITLTSLFVFFLFNNLFTQVKIGVDADLNTPPHPSSVMEVVSTNKGFLPPRLTKVQRDAIAAPAEGLTVYNTTEDCINVFEGTAWTTYCELRFSTACNCVEYLNDYDLPTEAWIQISGADRDWYEVGTTTAPDNINDAIYTQGRVGIGLTVPTVGLDLLHNDGLLARGTFGSGATPINGAGTRMVWNPNKAAFRAGQVASIQWNSASIGDHSGAIGLDNTSSGKSSMGFGEGLFANSRGEVSLGAYNAIYPPISATGFNNRDAVLNVGIGTSNFVRRDAFVILKSGVSYMNGSLDIYTPANHYGAPVNPFGTSLYVLNDGPSYSGSFITNTAANTFPTIFARTVGTGSVIQAENLNTNSTASTIYSYNTGRGRSVSAVTINTGSPAPTYSGLNDGRSNAMYLESRNASSVAANIASINRSAGDGIYADNLLTTSTSSTIYGVNRGLGETLYADNVNATSTASTIWGVNRGLGETIYADNQNNTSTASTIYSLNRGQGESLFASNINVSSTTPTIYTENNGLGESLLAINFNTVSPQTTIVAFNVGTGDGIYGAGGGNAPGVTGSNYKVGTTWTTFIPAAGIKDAGVSGTTNDGIAGVAGYNWTTNFTDLYDTQAGFFSSVYGAAATVASETRVDYVTAGGALRKIDGTGAAGTIVKDLDNKPVLMTCMESPEVLFSDYGRGELVNGKAYIQLDPIFTKNIVVDENNHMKVFIQLEGDCKGVYVSNKSETGFEVRELQGGNATVNFSYMVTANRANQQGENGITFPFDSSTRFAKGPTPIELTTREMRPSIKEDDPRTPKSQHLKELQDMKEEMQLMREEMQKMQEERRKESIEK